MTRSPAVGTRLIPNLKVAINLGRTSVQKGKVSIVGQESVLTAAQMLVQKALKLAGPSSLP